MPDWQPVSVPDFCPTCGVYWECECPREEQLAGTLQQRLVNSPSSIGRPAFSKDAPFDPNVQPVLRYIDEDEDDA